MTPGRPPKRSRSSRHLLGASLMVIVGAFLPWLQTGVGNVLGIRGPGVWTMYAGVLGIAGAIIRARRVAAAHAAVLAITATVLPLWQAAHVFSLVAFSGWIPGPGLVLTLGGGVVAGVTARRLWRDTPEATSG